MIVETTSGKVEGTSTAFKGIPFARAVRFQAPVPPAPWEGVLQATEYGPAAPQPYDEVLEAMFGLPPFPTDEESCLNLNVWTPGAGGAGRPVMVWFHGGAFRTGSGRDPVFDGTRLATRHEVVVVTVNYRLGALGYLYLGHRGANFGLLDQIAALRWVRANIAAFGGDPGNVTAFGQSAGAMSVAALMAAPAARGLFHKAIMQSGSAEGALTQERAAATTRDLLEKVKIDAPVDALLRAQATLGELPFMPVVDGVILPRQPLEAIRRGSAGDIPLLLGVNSEEGRLFTEDVQAGAAFAEQFFYAPTSRLAKAHPNTWRYRFSWPSRAWGACHSMELPFVFDNLGVPGIVRFTGPDAPQALADVMGEVWTSFSKGGAAFGVPGGLLEGVPELEHFQVGPVRPDDL